MASIPPSLQRRCEVRSYLLASLLNVATPMCHQAARSLLQLGRPLLLSSEGPVAAIAALPARSPRHTTLRKPGLPAPPCAAPPSQLRYDARPRQHHTAPRHYSPLALALAVGSPVRPVWPRPAERSGQWLTTGRASVLPSRRFHWRGTSMSLCTLLAFVTPGLLAATVLPRIWSTASEGGKQLDSKTLHTMLPCGLLMPCRSPACLATL